MINKKAEESYMNHLIRILIYAALFALLFLAVMFLTKRVFQE